MPSYYTNITVVYKPIITHVSEKIKEVKVEMSFSMPK